MSIKVDVKDSPGWWLVKLADKLAGRQERLATLAKYHDGDPPLPEGADAAKSAYQSFQKKARTNFAELIVGSVRERCTVRSIRTSADNSANGDAEAWKIWKDNGLNVEFADVLENMLALGDAYTITGYDDDLKKPIITGEDPRQVVTIHNPVRQSEVRGAIKMFHDPEAARDYAYLFLPGVRYVAFVDNDSAEGSPAFDSESWAWDEESGGEAGEVIPGNAVPVVRYRNRRGIGAFETHIDVLDRINHMLLQRMVIATMQAFRQRAVFVDDNDMPETDEEGNVIDYDAILSADPGSVWKLPLTAKLWESGQVDLQGILSGIHDDVVHLAAVTRTPISILAPDNQSAEGAKASADGLVFRCEDLQTRATAGLAQTFSYAFLFSGDEKRSDKSTIEVGWFPIERHTIAEKYDAASKAVASGEPEQSIWADVLQKTPDQIEQMKAARMDQAMLVPTAGEGLTPIEDAEALIKKAEALGALIRAGAVPEDAARLAGLEGLTFTPGGPVTWKAEATV